VPLKIAVDAGPLVKLGHQNGVVLVRQTATNVLSLDSQGHWILWDYSGATFLAEGDANCILSRNCSLAPTIDLAGSTAIIATQTGFEIRAASDGHLLGSVTTSATWWKLATDGSYIATGSNTGLSAWSPSGQLLFSRTGDYSHAIAFASPSQILIGAGAAGQSVVESISVPAGTSATGPQFNGSFLSWFVDGGHFITLAGTTALIYTPDGTQQGSVASIPATAAIVGQGSWVWTYPNPGAILNVYPATGSNPPPATTYTFNAAAKPYASRTTVAVVGYGSTAVSLIDLSGSTPSKTDYVTPVPVFSTGDTATNSPFATLSASQWLIGSSRGVLLDGGSLAGNARFFGFGQVTSIAGGTNHFAIATASGTILYFNAHTLAEEGQIKFAASKIVLSADGSMLVAQGDGFDYGVWSLTVYDLPAGSLQYTWPYAFAASTGAAPQDIVLSGSGTVLGQTLFTVPGGSMPAFYTQTAGAPTGGSPIFSSTFNSSSTLIPTPLMRISPDGTLIAYSLGSPTKTQPQTNQIPGTNLLQNGSLVTAFSGVPVGWLDNNRLLANNYAISGRPPAPVYTGCAIYGANGNLTTGACALSAELGQFQTIDIDTIYAPDTNQILAVSTGAVNWASGDPIAWYNTSMAAIGGPFVIFVSGTSVLTQSH
jgi:hypothetical protein